jgi:NAD(P)-dependent dehydrogenase (short-subunit alcohol dehydrogenase family)
MNRIVLITGGSRGLGEDIALRLAQTGCDVFITYRSELTEAEDIIF